MKFTVDRSTWYRGLGAGASKLLRQDGKRCCIGHVGKQLGIPDEALFGRGAIAQKTVESCWPGWMQVVQASSKAEDIDLAYYANDDADLTDAEREAKLQEIFARNGDEIEFVG